MRRKRKKRKKREIEVVCDGRRRGGRKREKKKWRLEKWNGNGNAFDEPFFGGGVGEREIDEGDDGRGGIRLCAGSS